MTVRLTKRSIIGLTLLLQMFAVIGLVQYQARTASAAACAPEQDYGTVSNIQVSIPATGQYRVWSRMAVPDSSNNSYFLEIDENNCYVVGDSSSIPASPGMSTPLNWQWIDYRDGNSNSKITVNLSAGMHTIKLIGREPDVAVDRVIFTADLSCQPIGTGDNCANPPDTTPPIVAITAPAQDAVVSGDVTISAVASDTETGISKVEFIIDSVVRHTTTTSPYRYSFNTEQLGLAPGSHTIRARAYDGAGNATSSATRTIIVGDTQKPSVTITEPKNGATNVSGTIIFAVDTSDNVGVAKVEFYVDDALDQTITSPPFSYSVDTTKLPNGSHKFSAKSFDAANNSASAEVTISINNPPSPPADTAPPIVALTVPSSDAILSGTVTLSAVASDNVGVKEVVFLVDGQEVGRRTSAPFRLDFDTTALTDGNHGFVARAVDAAGNQRTTPTVTAMIRNAETRPEDINQDGKVNLLDFLLLKQKYGQSGQNLGRTDINGDGKVNLLDFLLLKQQYGS